MGIQCSPRDAEWDSRLQPWQETQGSCRVMRVNSGFLSSHCMQIWPHLELSKVPWGSSSIVVVGNLRILLSCDRLCQCSLDLKQGSRASSVVERGNLRCLSSYSRKLVVHLSCGRKLEVHFELQRGFGGSSRVASGNSHVLLRPCS